ncbi:MAG: type II toxin-antitoxin system Phd/YefM family antitoxin [Candidatus Thiodiazotropha sp. (ex Epidulcina cf. delphinae)]|nr:type II toxin-antitoxin system Phd/YefM family antitoxin [Candidatus Thiodiazotropha sp. (ex Epidulcina cf. delphinae)]
MKASIVDLRYKMTDILKALDRNESVTVLYHGKPKGIIKPAREKSESRIKDHPFFGMYKEAEDSVLDELENLRNPRYDL